MYQPFIVYVLESQQHVFEYKGDDRFRQSFDKMVAQQVTTRTVPHKREHHVKLALVQERRYIRYEVWVHQLPSVVDLVLNELTVCFGHGVQIEVLHGHQVAAFVVLAEEHYGAVRETRAQHRAHRVLLQVRFEVHVTGFRR